MSHKFFLNKTQTPPIVSRVEPCRICGNQAGTKIGEVDYWDLQCANLVLCDRCNLIQMDPMLTNESIETGCFAYYLYDCRGTIPEEQARNLLRNYRRGIVFGGSLKKLGFQPASILEFGPGSGYFSAGVRHIFPDSKVTVVDIVDEVLEHNKAVHGFITQKGTPENPGITGNKKFDLIIARDILEHVSDIGKTIESVKNLLNPGGYFHFLTPNGYEDSWGHWLHFKKYGGRSELLINHVNYFDGQGLLDLLRKKDLFPVKYFTLHIKTILRGKGWSEKESITQKSSVRFSALKMLEENHSPIVSFDKNKILDHWYLRTSHIWLTLAWCRYKHHWLIKLPPSWNRGHEFYGLFRYIPV
ncbi:MAG: class I SAM-dependent methyltransferase [Bacteroidota bacterium]|nr:class I SAM-dependent methyltransferase [Bacteroidota bacterium]